MRHAILHDLRVAVRAVAAAGRCRHPDSARQSASQIRPFSLSMRWRLQSASTMAMPASSLNRFSRTTPAESKRNYIFALPSQATVSDFACGMGQPAFRPWFWNANARRRFIINSEYRGLIPASYKWGNADRKKPSGSAVLQRAHRSHPGL